KLRHLLDNFMKNIRAVEALKANNWDQLVIYMLSEKLDSDTRKTWEMSADAKKDDLTLDKMKDFLQLHCQALESAAGTRNKDRTATSNHQDHRRAKAHLVTVPPAPSHVHKCQVCTGNHPMYRNLLLSNVKPSLEASTFVLIACLRLINRRTVTVSIIVRNATN